MNFVQPSIDPVLLSFSFFEIRWYSLAYIFGFIIGSIIIKKIDRINNNIIGSKKIDSFFIWAVIGVILGGRFGYVLFYQLDIFIGNPVYLLEIWNGGMSFHGGLIGIVIVIFIFTKINDLDFYYLSDLVSIVAPIGLFLGRIANFINTELIGRKTDFYISIIYPTIDNIPRHPSQIYEAIFEGLLIFIILIYYYMKNKNIKKTGIISGLFLILYATFRFFLEFLREPDLHIGLLFNIITMGQVLSLPLFVFGIFIILINGKNRNS